MPCTRQGEASRGAGAGSPVAFAENLVVFITYVLRFQQTRRENKDIHTYRIATNAFLVLSFVDGRSWDFLASIIM